MRIRHVRPAVLEVTLHAYELTALVAAARWAAEGATGEMTPEARNQLQQVLANYEAGLKKGTQDRGALETDGASQTGGGGN